jgi:hypothetical protein
LAFGIVTLASFDRMRGQHEVASKSFLKKIQKTSSPIRPVANLLDDRKEGIPRSETFNSAHAHTADSHASCFDEWRTPSAVTTTSASTFLTPGTKPEHP